MANAAEVLLLDQDLRSKARIVPVGDVRRDPDHGSGGHWLRTSRQWALDHIDKEYPQDSSACERAIEAVAVGCGALSE
jgi:hypothetical protein